LGTAVGCGLRVGGGLGRGVLVGGTGVLVGGTGVLVAVGRGVLVGTGVSVGIGVLVGIGVAVGVSVGTGVSVGIGVLVGVRVAVKVGLGVLVGVAVGPRATRELDPHAIMAATTAKATITIKSRFLIKSFLPVFPPGCLAIGRVEGTRSLNLNVSSRLWTYLASK
jgi:hypothetical protein